MAALQARLSKSAHDTFRHEPLDLNAEQIRLITVVPSKSGIHLSLRQVLFTSAPEYTALSYTWGNANQVQTVQVDGRSFTVRQNLYDFLRTVNHDYTTSYWIDQMCIDQFNVDERNHQVGLMSEIYQSAREVIIWLGPSTDVNQHGMEFLMSLPNSHRHTLSPIVDERSVKGMRNLLNNPYWLRLWILQEILLARKLTVACGEFTVPWSALERFFYAHKPGSPMDELVKDIDVPDWLWKSDAGAIVREKQSFDGSYSRLSYMLETFSSAECEDPKDKIYGLLGLVPPERRIAIDYTQSLETVFNRAVEKFKSDEYYISAQSHEDSAAQIWNTLSRPGHRDYSTRIRALRVNPEDNMTNPEYNNMSLDDRDINHWMNTLIHGRPMGVQVEEELPKYSSFAEFYEKKIAETEQWRLMERYPR